MNDLLTILNKNSLFYKINLLLTITIAVFLCVLSRTEGFIFLNSFHTKTLKIFFQNITFLGDGMFTFLVSSVILVFSKKHRKLAFLLIMAYLFSGIFSQIFKSIITAPRPSVYFAAHKYKFYLDTFVNSRVGFRSFPSGHSASAFAMATIFSTYFTSKRVSVFSFGFGLLIGYSRIYLAHHFLIDVLGGAIIGILFASLSIVWYDTISLKIIKIITKQRRLMLKPWGTTFPNSSITNG
ncbi:phosphatase PAP2 family protein [Flavobacterium sp. LB1P71]|uniref:phosphatase PAP2 family protein n=1 Tax=unclassified Flavobacterium TaxID=196869 RepID=UPI003AAD7AE3